MFKNTNIYFFLHDYNKQEYNSVFLSLFNKVYLIIKYMYIIIYTSMITLKYSFKYNS